eukprot:TRINITY_DN13136_c1_g1_i1.p3 TRINITY_DN13136_c1_g1~~TRINITY_DN13136_c1_g1_i1.p3  ORF type:complete len:193 (-),score=-18.88 TRINITY_DN13136_c1_g1_i1:706-1284(-)
MLMGDIFQYWNLKVIGNQDNFAGGYLNKQIIAQQITCNSYVNYYKYVQGRAVQYTHTLCTLDSMYNMYQYRQQLIYYYIIIQVPNIVLQEFLHTQFCKTNIFLQFVLCPILHYHFVIVFTLCIQHMIVVLDQITKNDNFYFTLFIYFFFFQQKKLFLTQQRLTFAYIITVAAQKYTCYFKQQQINKQINKQN